MERVYGDYDQAGLDAQYDQSTLVPDISAYLKRWAEGGARARARARVEIDVAYGPSPAETADVFVPAGADGRPVHVYFHGGAWKLLDKSDGGFVAPLLLDAGAVFASAGFGLVPSVTLAEQVRQARALVAFLHRNAAAFGGDPDRIFVSGHSSGGHLVGCLVAAGWHADHGVPDDVVKGAVAASGLYDLEPVRRSARNQYLHLDDADVERLSPIRHIPARTASRLSILWGEGDLDEFRRQSREMAATWRAAGHDVHAEEIPAANHFDVGDAFAEPRSPIARAILAQLAG